MLGTYCKIKKIVRYNIPTLHIIKKKKNFNQTFHKLDVHNT